MSNCGKTSLNTWKKVELAFMLTFRGRTEISIKRACEAGVRLLYALRKQAERKNWEGYSICLWVSNTDPRTGKEVRPHIHGLLIAKPGRTVFNWLRSYWFKGNGMVKIEKGGVIRGNENYIAYCNVQSTKTFNRRYGTFGHAVGERGLHKRNRARCG